MTLEDDLRQAVGERQGTAIRFTDIDGIGQKTAQRIKQSGRIRSPSDISDKTAEELAEQAGISESRARIAIEGAGGDPDRRPRSNTGSVSAAGIRVPVGEFKPEISDKDTAEARFQSSLNRGIGRSQNAAVADKGKRAPVTTDVERWKDNKGELDFPGVDTPTDDPQVLPKDLRQEQRPATTDPPERQATATSRTFDRGRVFSNTTKTESVERGVSPEPNQGLQPVETAGVTGTSGFEGDKMGGEGLTDAGGARSGNVPQGFVDNLASGREADRAFTEAESGRGDDTSQQFDRTVTIGITPSTLGDGFTIETDDDIADRTLGSGTEVVEQADQNVGLPSANEADSTDVVAEADIGFQDRDSGFGYNTKVVDTRETDDSIFNFR
jgi:hypothetical protein